MNGLRAIDLVDLEEPEVSDRTLLAAAAELLERVADSDLVETEIEYLREVIAKIDSGEV